MIKVYYSPFCASCRKVKSYFKEKGIPFISIDILGGDLTEQDIFDILEKSDLGTSEIISERSKIMKEQKPDLDSMTLKELAAFIVKNPTILKRPIIVDDRKIQVGYDPDEITAFRADLRQLIIGTCRRCPLNGVCTHKPYATEARHFNYSAGKMKNSSR